MVALVNACVLFLNVLSDYMCTAESVVPVYERERERERIVRDRELI